MAEQKGYLGALARVTGETSYVNDVNPPGLLHMAVVRSPHPHAAILGVHKAEAEQLHPSVRVFTAQELLPRLNPIPHFLEPTVFGARHFDIYPLPSERVRYVGEPVAVVVADSRWRAVAAARAVRVDYRPLPAVLSPEESLRDDAPQLSPEGNVFMANRIGTGDATTALRQAPYRLRETLSIQRYTSAPLETRGYVAVWDASSRRLTYHASCQNPHQLRASVATALGLAESDVHVLTPAVGGSFGLKMHGHPEEPLVALLSMITGRPVKWIEDRSECLLIGGREQTHEFEVGFEADGTIVAFRDRVVADVGIPGATLGWAMARLSATTLPSGYRIPNVDIEYQAVMTNKPPWNATRGYGKESAIVAMERVVDMIARELGIDPVDVRRRNLLTAAELPHKMPAGFQIDSGDYLTVLEKAVELASYDEVRARQREETGHVRTGIGVAFEMTPEAGGIKGTMVQDYESATVRVAPTGAVTLLSGVTSPGGGNDSGLAQVVAASLGVPWREVRVIQGDTDMCPYGFGNYSGRSTLIGGGAAHLAATRMREKLLTAAADHLGRSAEELDLRDSAVVDADGTQLMTLAELSRGLYSGVIASSVTPPLEITETYRPGGVDASKAHNYPSFSNGVYIATVEVDTLTGVVKVREIHAVHDCGRVLDQVLVDGQIHGAIAMGIGGALFEEQRYAPDGNLLNDRFKAYLMARANDMPTITIAHHETPSPNSLLGTKGAGEAGIGGTVAAVASAVEDALAGFGARVRELPLTPPRVLAAMDARTREEVSS